MDAIRTHPASSDDSWWPGISRHTSRATITAASSTPNDMCVSSISLCTGLANQSQVSASVKFAIDQKRRRPVQRDRDRVVIGAVVAGDDPRSGVESGSIGHGLPLPALRLCKRLQRGRTPLRTMVSGSVTCRASGAVQLAPAEGNRMIFRKFALLVAAFTLAAPLAAKVQPAVQPGGDIPSKFERVLPAVPKGGDIPRSFNAPRGEFLYVRREAMIPMRDGVKLYTVLIIPKGVARAPIMLDRTPYSADKATGRGFGPLPENILSVLSSELVRAGYIVAFQDVRGKYKSEGDYVMNRPLAGRSTRPRSTIRPTPGTPSTGWSGTSPNPTAESARSAPATTASPR